MAARSQSRYIAGLDGIRAVAVLATVVVHFGLLLQFQPGAPGVLRHVAAGEFGVQIFFVLSGALITSLLVGEHRRSDDVDLRGFYLRRSRRLGPALVVVLVAMVVTTLLATTATSRPLGPRPELASVAIALFFGNWVLASGLPSGLGWLAPTWTLAIEEQFYLSWPAVLRRTMRRRMPRSAVLLLLGAALVASTGLAVVAQARWGWSHARTATPAQLPCIIIGCALGYELTTNPQGRLRRVLRSPQLATAGAVAMVALAIQTANDGRVLARGGYVGFAVATCLLVGHCFAVTDRSSYVTRLLSLRPAVAIGRVSYEMYLVHFAIIVAVLRAAPTMSADRMMLVDSVFTVVASFALYHWLEAPIRRSGWRAALAGLRDWRPSLPAVPTSVGVTAAVAVGVFVVAAGGAPAGGGPVVGAAGDRPQVPASAGHRTASSPAVTGPGSTSRAGSKRDEHQRAASAPAAPTRPTTAGPGRSSPARPAAIRVVAMHPSAGALAGGDRVTLVGRHLDGVTAVRFGGVSATHVTAVSGRRLVMTSPARSALGAVPVTVVAGSAEVAAPRFLYLPVPTVAESPSTQVPLQGARMTVHGTGFRRQVVVYFDDIRARGVRRLSASTLSVRVPAASRLVGADGVPAAKQITVVVRTPGGRSARVSFGHYASI